MSNVGQLFHVHCWVAGCCTLLGGCAQMHRVAGIAAVRVPQGKRWYSTTMFNEQFVNCRDVDFFVVQNGPKDGHPVFCMPGALGTAYTDFPKQLEGLAKAGLNVYSYDPRGYGKSRPPARHFPL
eukprot:Sspe_Gene.54117::Locus_29880_Transcript_1_1_Confidence_1.000_Length_694::g.54117::m.54117/K18399/BPHL; valacyclovir hydrolase